MPERMTCASVDTVTSSDPIQVDPRFRAAMPALDDSELEALEESLLTEGCRDALVVWRSSSGRILLDGHNRLAICSRHGLPFDVVEAEISDREAALDWIDRNQLGRRNLNAAQRALLRGRRYNRLKQSHGGLRRACPHSEGLRTAEILAEEFRVSRATIERDGRFAEALERLKDLDPELERRILDGIESPSRTAVVEAAELALFDPDAGWRRLKGTMTSTSFEWTTPQVIIQAVLQMWGAIDLDPCSPVEGPVVPARRHFTKVDDGLSQPWHGKIYLNPPYGREIADWTRKLLGELAAGRTTEAVMLGPCRTDARWMAELRQYPRCFLRGRLAFGDGEGTAPFASMVLYFGDDLEGFRDAFGPLGDIYVLLQ